MMTAAGRTNETRVRCPYCHAEVGAISMRVVLQTGAIERYDATRPHRIPFGMKQCVASLETHGLKL